MRDKAREGKYVWGGDCKQIGKPSEPNETYKAVSTLGTKQQGARPARETAFDRLPFQVSNITRGPGARTFRFFRRTCEV